MVFRGMLGYDDSFSYDFFRLDPDSIPRHIFSVLGPRLLLETTQEDLFARWVQAHLQAQRTDGVLGWPLLKSAKHSVTQVPTKRSLGPEQYLTKGASAECWTRFVRFGT